MKKVLSLCLCATLLFAVTGCKKAETPDEIEKRISDQLTNAKSIDANIKGSIAMEIPDAGKQAITIDTTLKTDTSTDFPKILLDGSVGLEGVMSFPMSFYMDDKIAFMSVLGQSEQIPMTDEQKNQIKAVIGKNGVKTDFNKTVKETKYNEQDAIEITFDTTAINQFLNAPGQQEGSVDSYSAYYVLKENKELDSIVIKMNITTEGQLVEINITAKINALDKPIDIQTPTTNAPINKTDRTLDILGQPKAS